MKNFTDKSNIFNHNLKINIRNLYTFNSNQTENVLHLKVAFSKFKLV